MPRPKVHDDALRGRLLDLTGRELSAHGPDALSLRKLANAAGTSTTAVYSLFGGKAELLQAVFDEAFERFGAHLAAVDPSDDPAEDIVALGHAYRASARVDPQFYGVMFGSQAARVGVAVASQERAAETFLPLVAMVGRAMSAGALRRDDPVRVATALWAVVHGLVSLELAGMVSAQAGDPDRLFDDAVRASVTGWA